MYSIQSVVQYSKPYPISTFHPAFQALFRIQIFIRYLMHFPVLNAEAIFKLTPVSKTSFHINLIQNIICYPKYHPRSTAFNLNTECNILSSIQIPNYYPKTGALSSIPSIIHYPTIQHPRYYPLPKVTSIIRRIVPYSKHYSISQIIIQNQSLIQYTKHYPLSNYPESKVLSIQYPKPNEGIINFPK